MAEGQSEKTPIVIENETGNVIKEPGSQAPRSREERIDDAAREMASAMTEGQRIAVLQTAHEAGLKERRKLAVKAGKAQRGTLPQPTQEYLPKKPWWRFW